MIYDIIYCENIYKNGRNTKYMVLCNPPYIKNAFPIPHAIVKNKEKAYLLLEELKEKLPEWEFAIYEIITD